MTAQPKPKTQEAPQAQEAQEVPAEQGKRKYTKRQPDNSQPGQLQKAVKDYAKFYRSADPVKAEEARKEEAEARKQLAEATDRAQQDELMKAIRNAQNRYSRVSARVGTTIQQQSAALDHIIELAQEFKAQLPESE